MNIKFAKLISYVTSIRSTTISEGLQEHQIEDIAEYVTACNEPAKITEEEINLLLKHMAGGCLKIEAIKSYRTLTGAGLKEAKDAVEKYWVNKPVSEDKMLSNLQGNR